MYLVFVVSPITDDAGMPIGNERKELLGAVTDCPGTEEFSEKYELYTGISRKDFEIKVEPAGDLTLYGLLAKIKESEAKKFMATLTKRGKVLLGIE
jgi:hypothetical protein